jgi:hypothetical protein
MSLSAAFGAFSLKLMACMAPSLSLIVINPPPPIPDDSACTMPLHNIPVMAAFTAELLLFRMSAAMSAHISESRATAPAKKIKLALLLTGYYYIDYG